MNHHIQALLLYLDGVLYVGKTAVIGTIEAMEKLEHTGLPIAGVTNTTTRSKRLLVEKLAAMGFSITAQQIFTPAALAVQRIGNGTAALYVHPNLAEDFASVSMEDDKPDFVVMGDVGGQGYDTPCLQQIFEQIMGGATLLALHKNRFWQLPEGLKLDLGPFVAAIEYATGGQAELLGKPSQAFFRLICQSLGCQPQAALMVGDDVESDIGGAQAAGLQTALVQTGKYRQAFVDQSGIKPDVMLASIAELPAWLELNNTKR
jgi:HAD superfamily hydrolase (TIGR01458 family)